MHLRHWRFPTAVLLATASVAAWGITPEAATALDPAPLVRPDPAEQPVPPLPGDAPAIGDRPIHPAPVSGTTNGVVDAGEVPNDPNPRAHRPLRARARGAPLPAPKPPARP